MSGGDLYILDELGKPVLEPDIDKWGEWMAKHDERRIVALSEEQGEGQKFGPIGRHGMSKMLPTDPIKVSTVFLGVDHGYKGKPLLYESMIFGGEHDGEELRCTTRKTALKLHRKLCDKAGIKE